MSTPSAALPETGAAERPTLDMEIVEDLKEMMGSDYRSLVRIYLEDSPKLIGQIQIALNNRDCQALVAPAHTLKSSSANLGAMALAASAKRIELGARTGKLPRPTIAVVLLETEFRKAQTALQRLQP